MYGLPSRKPIANITGSVITLRDPVYGEYHIEPGESTIPRDVYLRGWRKLQGKVIDRETTPKPIDVFEEEAIAEEAMPDPFSVDAEDVGEDPKPEIPVSRKRK